MSSTDFVRGFVQQVTLSLASRLDISHEPSSQCFWYPSLPVQLGRANRLLSLSLQLISESALSWWCAPAVSRADQSPESFAKVRPSAWETVCQDPIHSMGLTISNFSISLTQLCISGHVQVLPIGGHSHLNYQDSTKRWQPLSHQIFRLEIFPVAKASLAYHTCIHWHCQRVVPSLDRMVYLLLQLLRVTWWVLMDSSLDRQWVIYHKKFLPPQNSTITRPYKVLSWSTLMYTFNGNPSFIFVKLTLLKTMRCNSRNNHTHSPMLYWSQEFFGWSIYVLINNVVLHI